MSRINTNCNETFHNNFFEKKILIVNIQPNISKILEEKYKNHKKKLVKSKEICLKREQMAHYLLINSRNKTLSRGKQYE